MWQRREMLGMKATEISDITSSNTKNIIAFAGDQEAGENLWHLGHGGLEFGQHLS